MNAATQVIRHLGSYGYLNPTLNETDMIKCLKRALATECRALLRKAQSKLEQEYKDKDEAHAAEAYRLKIQMKDVEKRAALVKDSSAKAERDWWISVIRKYFSVEGGDDRDKLIQLIKRIRPGAGELAELDTDDLNYVRAHYIRP